MLVETVAIWCRILFYSFYNFAEDYTAESGVIVLLRLINTKMIDFDHRNPSKNPSFLYDLGDVIYKFGEASEYYSQFYEPYAHYPAPIFAIPGNKDGESSSEFQ
jgi:hypothetical protein